MIPVAMPVVAGSGCKGRSVVEGWTVSALFKTPVFAAVVVIGICVGAGIAMEPGSGDEVVPHPITQTIIASRQKRSGRPMHRFYQIRCATSDNSREFSYQIRL